MELVKSPKFHCQLFTVPGVTAEPSVNVVPLPWQTEVAENAATGGATKFTVKVSFAALQLILFYIGTLLGKPISTGLMRP